MHCSECERLKSEKARAGQTLQIPARQRPLAQLGLLFCEHCGSALAVHDETDSLLAKLSQLARFGLAAEDHPILADRQALWRASDTE
jgi:hypothetical protein